ncbi:hypothetical protein VF08_37850, partial [Nostoc linckia z8]
GAMAGKVKDDNLRTGPTKPQGEIGQILGPRSPAMDDKDPLRPPAMQVCRQMMRRRHPAAKGKTHGRCLAQTIAPCEKDLLCLDSFRASARRPAEELESNAPRNSG